ncbi:chromosomal replication initiator protein DnaA [Corynebacterium sp. H78]|uniref:chromosomal replication initiator protein DnaA n=1 Tax=Corynebacterium sp. H78 TaxID=3133417 RepID=UPI0030A4A42D
MCNLSEESMELEQLWKSVLDVLLSDEGAPDLGIEPLAARHKVLLRSVSAGGLFPGFILLVAQNEITQTLAKLELKDEIEKVLTSITGEPFSATITIAEPEQSAQQFPTQHNVPQQMPSQAPQGQDYQEPQHFGDHTPPVPMPPQPSSAHPGQSQQLPHQQTPQQGQVPQQSAEFQEPYNDWRSVNLTHGGDSPQAPQAKKPFQRYGRTAETPFEMMTPDREPSLNPKYTFETFVIGPQNQFAHASAIAVAEQPARAYNPLFISGGSGLGKTHLLHAIGHYARNLDPKLRVRYVSSEEFTNDFINSVRDDAQESFKRRYRELDMLMIDDIQFLEGKEGTQDEFFHTFNALHQANRQIVLTSDRPPRELKTLEERLRTRFEWGLMTDLQFPDLETRIAILSKKARIDDLQVPHEVLQYIAENASSSIRELEGSLIQVTANASMRKIPVTLELAEEIIGTNAAEIELTPDIIISATAEYYDLKVSDLLGSSKTRPVAHARQIAMYLTRSLIDLSLPAIGKEFGNRDHSTVLYAYRKISKEIAEKKPTKDQVNDLTTRVRDKARGH